MFRDASQRNFFALSASRPSCVFLNSQHHMFRLLGTVARGSTAVGFRHAPKTGLGGGGPATTALFCISALWGVGQTVSFATVRTPQAMSSSTVDVSFSLVFVFAPESKKEKRDSGNICRFYVASAPYKPLLLLRKRDGNDEFSWKQGFVAVVLFCRECCASAA